VRGRAARCAARRPVVAPDARLSTRLNRSGTFVAGGAMNDNGQTGRKLVCDFYGPRVPIGGGALSGKDPWRLDRAGAFRARQIALAIVDTGFVRDALVTLAWCPRDRRPSHVSILVDGRTLDAADVARWTRRFDPSLAATREELGLAGVNYENCARTGPTGSSSTPARWEPGRAMSEMIRWKPAAVESATASGVDRARTTSAPVSASTRSSFRDRSGPSSIHRIVAPCSAGAFRRRRLSARDSARSVCIDRAPGAGLAAGTCVQHPSVDAGMARGRRIQGGSARAWACRRGCGGRRREGMAVWVNAMVDPAVRKHNPRSTRASAARTRSR
jgi:hypothetical protein